MLSSSRALIRSLTVCFRGYSFVGSGWFFFQIGSGFMVGDVQKEEIIEFERFNGSQEIW